MKLKRYLLCFLMCNPLWAATYGLPDIPNDSLVGATQTGRIQSGDTIIKIARQYETGYEELMAANAEEFNKKHIYIGKSFTVPTLYVLPNTPHDGIVINLPEMRLYYYPENLHVVLTFPVAVGRAEWRTPTLTTKIIEKKEDPTWTVPDSILAEKAERGIDFPKTIPPGDNNPLGKYALRLGSWSLLIHGTNQPNYIGTAASSGCIRMYPENIEILHQQVALNTPVYIVNEPYKLGWLDNKLYLEVHKPFEEEQLPVGEEMAQVHEQIEQALQDRPDIVINYEAVDQALEQHTGIPVCISE